MLEIRIIILILLFAFVRCKFNPDDKNFQQSLESELYAYTSIIEDLKDSKSLMSVYKVNSVLVIEVYDTTKIYDGKENLFIKEFSIRGFPFTSTDVFLKSKLDHCVYSCSLHDEEKTKITCGNLAYYVFNSKLISLNDSIIEIVSIATNSTLYKHKFCHEILNIFGLEDNNRLFVETGEFFDGGVSKLQYFNLDMDSYELKECTELFRPLNNFVFYIDEYYTDKYQEYYFMPSEKMLNLVQTTYDDYIFNAEMELVGRALAKSYNNLGYCLENNTIKFFFFESFHNKIICYPVNIDFEVLAYNIYHDKSLKKSELNKLSKFEVNLVCNILIAKNGGRVEDERIKDVLLLFNFYNKIKPSDFVQDFTSNFNQIEEQNYKLIRKYLNESSVR